MPPPPPALAPPIGRRVGAGGGAYGIISGAGAAARGPGTLGDNLSRRATAATPAPALPAERLVGSRSGTGFGAATNCSGATEPGSVELMAATFWLCDDGPCATGVPSRCAGEIARTAAARLRDDSVATAGVATEPVETGSVSVATRDTTVAPALGPVGPGDVCASTVTTGFVTTGFVTTGDVAVGFVAVGGAAVGFVAVGGAVPAETVVARAVADG